MVLLLAAHFLGGGFCQTPHAQTRPTGNAGLRPAPAPNPSVRPHPQRKGTSLHAGLLLGVWSDCRDCHAIFWIEGRRVNFFDELGSEAKAGQTSWKLVNNQLSFCYGGGLVVTDTVVKLTQDSLVTYRKDVGTARYVRLK
jgi:hypothetical protein